MHILLNYENWSCEIGFYISYSEILSNQNVPCVMFYLEFYV